MVALRFACVGDLQRIHWWIETGPNPALFSSSTSSKNNQLTIFTKNRGAAVTFSGLRTNQLENLAEFSLTGGLLILQFVGILLAFSFSLGSAKHMVVHSDVLLVT